jgi:hypothetical protein
MPSVTHCVTWLWGSMYSPLYVDRLAEAVRRNTTMDVRFICVTDNPAHEFCDEVDVVSSVIDPHLTHIKGCFARLRLFDPLWFARLGIITGDRVVNLDLDMVIVANIDEILWRKEPFVILQGVNNPDHPCPFNGSVWSLQAGYRPDVWRSFSVEAAAKVPKARFADDQGWMHHMMPAAAAYSVHDGVYAFMKAGWPGGTLLPYNARIVAFPGARDPSQFTEVPWIRKHWLGE